MQAYGKGFREFFRVRTNEIKNVLAKKRRMDAGIPPPIDDSGGTRDQQGKVTGNCIDTGERNDQEEMIDLAMDNRKLGEKNVKTQEKKKEMGKMEKDLIGLKVKNLLRN